MLVRFFRSAGSVNLDKQDLKRYREFVDTMIDHMTITARNSAKWNGRDVIAPPDLPITKALQERMREFDKFGEADDIRVLLARTVRRPPEDVTFDDETLELLPELFGGLSVALARSFKVIDPDVVNPATGHWERVFELFNLVA